MKPRVRHLLLGLVGVACLLGMRTPAQAQRIAIITTDTLTATQRSISGAKTVITKSNPRATFLDLCITRPSAADAQLADSLRQLNPDAVLTVGSAATEYAQKQFKSVPIVFSSVMYPIVSGFVESFNRPGRNITGASLSIPAKTQFEYFRMIIPELKSVGVLYTDNTASLIPPSRAVAKSLGLELVAINVSSEKELPAAFDSLTKCVQGIWSLADPQLFSPQSTKYILINALRKGVPLMGFSRNVVESGALFALDFDYKAVGRQAGEIVCQVLRGGRPENISVTTPDIIWFHYNENTAQHINIKIPEQLVAVAKEVYR